MVTVAVKTADRQQVFIFEQFGSGDKKNDIKNRCIAIGIMRAEFLNNSSLLSKILLTKLNE
jgi:hypothetical protein